MRSSGAASTTSPASSTGPSAPYTHRSDIGSAGLQLVVLFAFAKMRLNVSPFVLLFAAAGPVALVRRESPVQRYGYPGLQFLGGDAIAGEDADPFQAEGEDAVLGVHPADAGQAGQRVGAFGHKLGFAAPAYQERAAS